MNIEFESSQQFDINVTSLMSNFIFKKVRRSILVKPTQPKSRCNRNVKVVANEDTMLRTHCCGHKCFPVCPCAQQLIVADTNFVSETQKNVSDFCQKHFVSATNVSPFTQHGHKTNVLCPARLLTQETS